MEVYILDNLLRYSVVVDKFESLIWTERSASTGDFELHVFSTLENRNLFFPGVRIATNTSLRVMTVETVEDTTDADDRRLLKITGPSLEDLLNQRLAMAAMTDLTTDPKWIVTGLPKDVATQLFHDICVTGILNSGDIIAGVTEGSIFPSDTIAAPADSIIYSIDPKPLYTAIKDLCDAYSMGFRLVRELDTGDLFFDVYMGRDRTTLQTTIPAVVFSPDMENLQSTRKLTSAALYKNVAYVVSAVGHEIVYQTDVDPSVAGFERRVLFVNASDINDPDPPTASAQMIQRGNEELAKNRQITVLDGELTTTSQYVYGVDYNLNDLVELRDEDGAASVMRVTEQIFISDKEGDRAYPTLSINSLILPGTWITYGSVEWDDFTTEHWDELPS